MSGEVVFEISPDYFKRSQVRRKKRIEARRKAHSGKGRTDGPRKRKGVPAYTTGRRPLDARQIARIEKADAAKTHDVVFGVDKKSGKAVLRLDARPPKQAPVESKLLAEIATQDEAVAHAGQGALS